jgi:hypothetical protein
MHMCNAGHRQVEQVVASGNLPGTRCHMVHQMVYNLLAVLCAGSSQTSRHLTLTSMCHLQGITHIADSEKLTAVYPAGCHLFLPQTAQPVSESAMGYLHGPW